MSYAVLKTKCILHEQCVRKGFCKNLNFLGETWDGEAVDPEMDKVILLTNKLYLKGRPSYIFTQMHIHLRRDRI